MTHTKQAPILIDPTGREHILVSETTTIGRAIENDVVITSKRISREHVHIRREGWRVMLVDMGSTNGTRLNGERIHAERQLRDGDHIEIGDVTLIFHDPDVTHQDTPIPELDVDEAAGVVRVNRQVVSLAPKEFDLLVFLYHHAGQVRSKDDIGQAVWPEYHEGVYDYQIENLVRRLRSKLEIDPGEPQLLLTVRGRGYKLISSS